MPEGELTKLIVDDAYRIFCELGKVIAVTKWVTHRIFNTNG